MAHLRELTRGRGPGEALPSSRALVAELGVGPVTVRRAVAQLVGEGLLSTRPGLGTFVAHPVSRPGADTGWQQITLGASPVDAAARDSLYRLRDGAALQMAIGYPEAALRPDGRIAAAMARAARRPDAWSTPPEMGVTELRTWFAGQIGVDREDILISGGCQGAISAILRALLPSGSPVLFSTPTYPGAVSAARSAGLTPYPVPCDEDGVRPDLLARAFTTTGARLAYLQPTYANPDGSVLAPDRRDDVIAAAVGAGAFILEDDWARWLGHTAAPAPPPLARADADGHVITITSLTKAAAPSLRIGAVAARGPVLQRIAAMRLVDSLFVPRPLQEAAVELVTSAGWQSHLHGLARALHGRAAAVTAAVARHLPGCTYRPPTGGICAWLGLPRGTSEEAVVEGALGRGLAVGPGRVFHVGEPDLPHVRLSFASIEAGRIDGALRILAEALDAAD